MPRDRILIVEDDAILRDNLAEVLRAEDFDVLTASDAYAGQAIASEELPDLIISDVMMTDRDGFEMAARLSQQPHTSLIPIVFLTAKAAKEDFRAGLDLGAEDYLPKPCPVDKLLSVVRMRLSRRRNLEKHLVRQWRTSGPNFSAVPSNVAVPLRQIMGFAGVLGEHSAGLDHVEIGLLAQDISQAASRLSRKLTQVRLRDRLELGLPDVIPADSSESTTCDAVSTLTKAAEQSDLYLQRAGDLKMAVQPATLGIRERILGPVIVELLTNAFQYSRRGTMVQLLGEAGAQTYRVTLRDEGPGLTPARLAEMQRPLDVPNPAQAHFGGLMAARFLLQSVGISLEVESRQLAGTSISFVVPAAPPLVNVS